MAKINFTDEHMLRLRTLIADAVLNNSVISGPMGQNYNVIELVHCLTPESLITVNDVLKRKRDRLAIDDDWIANPNQEEIVKLDDKIELVKLIRGYKIKLADEKSNRIEKERIQTQIDELIQAQKSPKELIADLQAKLAELE